MSESGKGCIEVLALLLFGLIVYFGLMYFMPSLNINACLNQIIK
jgi:hypothetical protein